MGFGVKGLGFWVKGLEFGVQGLGFRVRGLRVKSFKDFGFCGSGLPGPEEWAS